MINGYKLVDPRRPKSRRLIMAADAHQKHGKTHFSLTAPGPIAYMDFDQRYEGVIEEFLAQGKTISWRADEKGNPRPYRIPDAAGASDESFTKIQQEAKDEWRKFEDDFEGLTRDLSLRTVVVDLATEAWELLRLAAFGRLLKVPQHLYGEANGAYRRLIRLARKRTDLNLILLHRLGKEYENKVDSGSGQIKGVETGRYERKGFSDTGFLVDVNVTLYRLPATDCLNGATGFRLRVDDSGANPMARGIVLEEENVNFPFLAAMIDGESSPEEWA